MPSRLARTLVRMNTVSRNSNLELIHFIRDELARHGVTSTLTFDDERKKANLVRHRSARASRAGVIVSGHTDTVPWDGQDWSLDPLGAEVKDGRLYGRGSADMKSFIGLARRAGAGVSAPPICRSRSTSPSATTRKSGCFGAPRLIADLRERGIRPAGLHRRRADRHGAGAGAQGRLPLALLRQGQGGALVADAAGGQCDRGRRARRRQARPTWRSAGATRAAATRASTCPTRTGVGRRDRGRHRRQRRARGLPLPLRIPQPARRRRRRDAGRGARLRRERSSRRCARWRRRPASASRRSARRRRSWRAPTIRRCCSPAASPKPTRRRWSPFGTEAGLFQRAGIPTVVCGPGHIAQAHQADEYVSLGAARRRASASCRALMTVGVEALVASASAS